jgi:hypothetical protein
MPLPVAAIAAPAVGAGIYSFMQAGKKTPAEKIMQSTLGEQNRLYNLLTDPNNPEYQAMLESETNNVRGGFLQQLRDLVEQNRRQALMGRQEIFDPERRDESMFTVVNRTGKEAQTQAKSNLLDRINRAMNALNVRQQGLLGLANLQQGRNKQKTDAITSGASALTTGLSKFL